MKKIIFAIFLVVSTISNSWAQKPDNLGITGDKVPLYCGSSINGDSTRLPIFFKATLSGLNPGVNYKYYVTFIKISDTSNTNIVGYGNPIFVKSSGNWRTTSTPDINTAGQHDTFSLSGPMYTAWFGAYYDNNSRFTPGDYIYPMIVFQEVGTSDVFKKYISDSIKVLGFNPSSGSNNGTAIFGNSFAAAKNIIALYDNTTGVNTRPITVSYSESEGISNSNSSSWYSSKVNGVSGAWGSIIPNDLGNGIKRIENIDPITDFIVYANNETDAIWGTDSTINPRKGFKPIHIKSDFAPLMRPIVEFVSTSSTVNEGVGVHKLLVVRKFGNQDTVKVDVNYLTGSALNTLDVNLLTTKLTFKPYGSLVDTIRVQIIDDLLNETTENANFRISNGVNAVINNLVNTHQVNITDNDIPKIVFAKKSATVFEDNGLLKVKVKINSGGMNTTNFRVAVRYKNDSAFIPADFKFGSSNRDSIIQFPGGKAFDSLEFNINIINNNTPELINDTILLAIRNPQSPATVGADSLFRLVIIDDDLPPLFTFDKSFQSVSESVGSVNVKVLKNGKNKFTSDVIMSIHTPTTTATPNSDFTFSTKILPFELNQNDTLINIPIINDNVNEKIERVFFVIKNSYNARIGKPDTFQIVINDDDLPVYNISRVTSFKSPNNVIDSIGVNCGVRGVVYGGNLSSSGVDFTIIDPTGGIKIINNSNKSYNVTERDSVVVYGRIAQINGMAVMNQLDTIIKISSFQNLRNPNVITSLSETTESRLSKYNMVKLSNPAQWPSTALAANSQRIVKVLTQTDSFDMLIDSETNIDGTAAPLGFFNIIGLGGQNDNSSPFNSGYYIAPRRLTDVELLTVPTFSFVTPTSTAVENRDSSNGFVVKCDNLTSNQQIAVVIKGGTAARNIDYQAVNPIRLFVLSPSIPNVTVKFKMTDDAAVDANETIILALRSNQWGTLISADSVHTVTIIDDESTDIADITLSNNTSVYPNPAQDVMTLTSTALINKVKIFSLNGQNVFETLVNKELTHQINTESLLNGVYIVKIYTEEGVVTKNLIITK